MTIDETTLLAVLNSAPVIDGRVVEQLEDPRMRVLRDALHGVIRGTTPPAALNGYLRGVSRSPYLDDGGVGWTLEGPAVDLPYAELVLEWARVEREHPGRLRSCANEECNKFLIDHSKPNSARWCSMAECGNRMKARRHHARQVNAGS
jgi:predicted RNA-binding Zn ribbon-like protein